MSEKLSEEFPVDSLYFVTSVSRLGDVLSSQEVTAANSLFRVEDKHNVRLVCNPKIGCVKELKDRMLEELEESYDNVVLLKFHRSEVGMRSAICGTEWFCFDSSGPREDVAITGADNVVPAEVFFKGKNTVRFSDLHGLKEIVLLKKGNECVVKEIVKTSWPKRHGNPPDVVTDDSLCIN